MLLAVDIGNTNVIAGIYSSDVLVTSWRLATERSRMPDEWWAIIRALAEDEQVDLRTLDGAIISSVVPRLTTVFTDMVERRTRTSPVVLSDRIDLGVGVLVDNPAEVGADRLANSAAVFARHGGPAVVVDCGTATSFDVVSAEGDYIGGAIAPGIMLAMEALTGRAARLSSIELEFPPKAIGRNTIECIQSGTFLGYVGLVEGLLTRITAELGESPIVIATGGLGGILSDHTDMIHSWEPNLTLDGLRIIYERVVGAPTQ